jgi:hypothetical protein
VVPTTEVPHVPSQIVAPAGFLPTAEEKREMAAAGPRSPRHSGHSDDVRELAPRGPLGRLDVTAS